ncbi:protein-glutamate O-methyltransferase CheR [Caldibacillus lycopersici]|uniref:protein-glutamate O-methyltransferase n=1 Tax=Perspicuibacillus lycopersici TaxID=1325689 RepID=A0AAE3LNA0_9BACI|nr:protein-glutamate O-methyltransferase CheR [Perspicuibacillus lycopersici]MCU9613706.1 protein-glutamate O-methyltransferase CheR [Perspicuibacillus lycopersici]
MDKEYQQFAINIKRKTGIDLMLYKEAQMKRRLISLYQQKGYQSFQEFYDGMINDPKLLALFLDRVTINVTEFFRNPKRWEVLENKIIPMLLSNSKQLKIWSAACSSGEEPYTLAILLNKYLSLANIHILATDIDANILEKAKLGIYNERNLVEVPEDIRKQYFHKEDALYKINEKIKRTVTFQKRDLLKDSFEKNLDLIVCRNVLIYFTEEAKTYLYKKFSESLRPGGVLFVGSTEQIFFPDKYGFEPIDNFFYRKVK